MSDLEVLREMVAESAKLSIVPHYQKHKVLLTEPECTDSSVEIHNIPQDAIVIKVDSFPSPINLFAGSRGECCRGDYIILAEKDGQTVAIHIELKRTGDKPRHIENQLRGTYCLLVYCQAIGQHFWQERSFLADAVHRFVLFAHTGSIQKRRTRERRKAVSHNSPEKALALDWCRFAQFNKLVGHITTKNTN